MNIFTSISDEMVEARLDRLALQYRAIRKEANVLWAEIHAAPNADVRDQPDHPVWVLEHKCGVLYARSRRLRDFYIDRHNVLDSLRGPEPCMDCGAFPGPNSLCACWG